MNNIFGTRLKEVRSSKNITQKQFAEIIGVKERQYQNYEIGASTPNFKTLVEIADYFNVSLDWLTGRSEDKTVH